jgi:hypothetical protein
MLTASAERPTAPARRRATTGRRRLLTGVDFMVLLLFRRRFTAGILLATPPAPRDHWAIQRGK